MNEEIKILCVDDEPNVLNALKRLFLDEPYTILTATSGTEGLKIFEREYTPIIISDYRMPEMNGVEFLKKIFARHPETVRIVLSGYADTSAIVSAINEGQIYKFVPKPWNDDELKVTVSNAGERYFLYKKNLELTSELQKKNEELTLLNTELQKLIEEKSSNLEFRSKVLTAHQKILDSMPVGILGIDLSNAVVMNNSVWFNIAGSEDKSWCILGQNIGETAPEDIKEFIEEVKIKHKAAKSLAINGVYGKLSGVLMEQGDNQKGIILVFTPKEDIQ
ncbi:MAG: response regulator [Nitrospirae bacterium]|nr:response regulator [Nitrospirota bacterium]